VCEAYKGRKLQAGSFLGVYTVNDMHVSDYAETGVADRTHFLSGDRKSLNFCETKLHIYCEGL
jgi:hypothetical protein